MPAATYELIKDYDSSIPEEGEVISVSPYWVLGVVRLKNPSTFSRSSFSSSTSLTEQDGVFERGEPLIITSDCIKLTVGRSKGNHLKNLNASLISSDTKYIAEVLPGDWVGAWIVNNEEKGLELVRRLRNREACNNADDGWKFLGRVINVRKTVINDRNSGIRTSRFSIQAIGFKELDATVFYNPALQIREPGVGTWMFKLGKSLTELITSVGDSTQERGTVSVNKAIPFFLDLLIGTGIPKKFANPGQNPEFEGDLVGAKRGTTAPFAYLVPTTVGSWGGRESRAPSAASGILAYADILELLHGVHKYKTGNAQNNSYGIFTPEGVNFQPQNQSFSTFGNGSTHKTTGIPLLGSFLPEPPNFSNQSVWTILSQFLNPSVNEMYTCMRLNEKNKIAPTIVLRQFPFSSDSLAKQRSEQTSTDFNLFDQGPLNTRELDNLHPIIPEITTFLELPRWKIHPNMVYEFDIGRSDALRFNFVWVVGQSSIPQKNADATYQLVRSPPVRDDIDIMRNGLRAAMMKIDCSLTDARQGPKAWTMIISDILMGQHLTLNGTLNCIGIQSPISEGDNIEFDGIVFHIEDIVDDCNINTSTGQKTFITSMTLSHGIKSDNRESRGESIRAAQDMPDYTAINKDDNLTYNPGLTTETVSSKSDDSAGDFLIKESNKA